MDLVVQSTQHIHRCSLQLQAAERFQTSQGDRLHFSCFEVSGQLDMEDCERLLINHQAPWFW